MEVTTVHTPFSLEVHTKEKIEKLRREGLVHQSLHPAASRLIDQLERKKRIKQMIPTVIFFIVVLLLALKDTGAA